MHNRDMVWTTADGRKLKLRDITTKHLCNISARIEKVITNKRRAGAIKKLSNLRKNIKLELRLRKLNRLNINNEEDKLF